MRSLGSWTAAVLVGAAAGCSAIAGLGDFEDAPGGGTGGATGGGGTSAGGGGTGGTGGTAGGGGTGGTGGGGGQGGVFDQPPALYSVSFGSAGVDTMGAVTADDAGNAYFGATHFSTIVVAESHDSIVKNPLIAELNPFLVPQWSASFDVFTLATVDDLTTSSIGTRTTMVGQVSSTIDFGGGDLVAQGTDAYVARFDSAGGHLFSSIWGDGNNQRAYAIDNVGGGFVVGGTFGGTIDFGSGGMTTTDVDGFVARFDHNNVIHWVQRIGGLGSQEVRALVVDVDNDRVYVTGVHTGEANVGGNIIAHEPNNTTNDGFVLALDLPTGAYVNQVAFNDAADIVPRSIALDPNGALLVAGTFHGGFDPDAGTNHLAGGAHDGFVVKLGTDLGGIWSQQFGGANADHVRSAAFDGDGNIIAVGSFFGTVDFGAGPRTATHSDAFVVKLTGAGQHMWSGTYGGDQNDVAVDVATDSFGNIIVGGEFHTSIHFGQDVHMSVGGSDLWLARFAPTPE